MLHSPFVISGHNTTLRPRVSPDFFNDQIRGCLQRASSTLVRQTTRDFLAEKTI